MLEARPSARPTPTQAFAIAVLLTVLTFLAYRPSLKGSFLWDDDAHVSQNDALKSVQGLSDIWTKPGAVQQYYPVTYSVFWAEYHLWKDNTLGYHLVNVALHVVNALLLVLILNELGIGGAWLAGFLFALHPVAVESVAWISELKNVLSVFFYLLSFYAFLRFFDTHGGRAWAWYVGAFLCFVLAALAKSVTVTLPAAVLLVVALKKKRLDWRDAAALLPVFAAGVAMGLYTAWMEKHVIGAGGTLWHFSWPQRFIIAGHAFWFYAGKLFWPARLSFIYPRWTIAVTPLTALYPASVLLALLILWILRRRLGPVPFGAAAFFAGTLAPALGFIDFYPMRFSFVADHFQYLASIGMIVFFVWMLRRLFERIGVMPSSRLAILIGSLVVLNVGLATRRESRKYQNAELLWKDTLSKNDQAALAHHNIGILWVHQGKFTDGSLQLHIAEELDPTYPQTQLALAFIEVHNGHDALAVPHYERAIALGVDDPDILHDFGRLLLRLGQTDEAVVQLQNAAHLAPDSKSIAEDLGRARALQGESAHAPA